MDAKQIAYSVFPPSTYTGALKLTVVATEPSAEVITSSGASTISENGRICCVGNPLDIDLIWKTQGTSISSFVLKNISHFVIKIPLSSSTKNDWAKGSYHELILLLPSVVVVSCPTSVVPRLSSTFLSWNSCLCSILAFLIERIFSWTVSNVPEAVYVSSVRVVALFGSLSGSLVNVKTLVPVSNLGWLILFGLGRKNEPAQNAETSESNFTPVTVAFAPLLCPWITIPSSI